MRTAQLKKEIQEKGVEAYDVYRLTRKFLALSKVTSLDLSHVNGGNISHLYLTENNAGALEVLDGNGVFRFVLPVFE